MTKPISVLVVGCGHMGTSHALAYQQLDRFHIVGVVSRSPETRDRLSSRLGDVPTFDDFERAFEATQPDAVSINTYTATHAPYAIYAMENGAHVFVEKPLGVTIEEAEAVVDTARATNRKLVVGYILRHHPSWQRFITETQQLGKPLVMRLNLNQQSSQRKWEVHKNLMASQSPIVDCGVHYVDVMCQMTQSRPLRVSAIGARLSDEIPEGMVNYGQLQVTFEDGSVGWYESGWGPMVSETAHFVKDVFGPSGSVSIVPRDGKGKSDDIDGHTATHRLRIHQGALDEDGRFLKEDRLVDLSDEPNHQALCLREQQYFLNAIENDVDLSEHHSSALNSLRIVLAADEAARTGSVISLNEQVSV